MPLEHLGDQNALINIKNILTPPENKEAEGFDWRSRVTPKMRETMLSFLTHREIGFDRVDVATFLVSALPEWRTDIIAALQPNFAQISFYAMKEGYKQNGLAVMFISRIAKYRTLFPQTSLADFGAIENDWQAAEKEIAETADTSPGIAVMHASSILRADPTRKSLLDLIHRLYDRACAEPISSEIPLLHQLQDLAGFRICYPKMRQRGIEFIKAREKEIDAVLQNSAQGNGYSLADCLFSLAVITADEIRLTNPGIELVNHPKPTDFNSSQTPPLPELKK